MELSNIIWPGLSNIIWPRLSNIMKDLETYRVKHLIVSYEKPSAMKVFFLLFFVLLLYVDVVCWPPNQFTSQQLKSR
jgi:hypothetical protein